MDSRVKAGEKVYIRCLGGVDEKTIARVGRKWFYVKIQPWKEERFDVETLEHDYGDYSQNCIQLYFDPQEILDENEHRQLSGVIRKAIDTYGPIKLSLSQLRRIHAIIQEGKDGAN